MLYLLIFSKQHQYQIVPAHEFDCNNPIYTVLYDSEEAEICTMQNICRQLNSSHMEESITMRLSSVG